MRPGSGQVLSWRRYSLTHHYAGRFAVGLAILAGSVRVRSRKQSLRPIPFARTSAANRKFHLLADCLYISAPHLERLRAAAIPHPRPPRFQPFPSHHPTVPEIAIFTTPARPRPAAEPISVSQLP